MNKKGQALVEFIIILPVAVMLIFCIVDFGRIISLKNTLENISSDVVLLYQNGKLPEEINSVYSKKDKDLKIEYKLQDDYVNIIIKKNIKPITPGFNYIKKELFEVTSTRVIKNE